MRADQDRRACGGVASPLAGRAGQQAAGDPELAAQLLDGQEVLLGERLGRGHQRALVAALDPTQERVQRDGRLPRPHVALEQPLHRRRPREIAVEVGDRLLLVLGELERQRGPVALEQLSGLSERRRDLVLALARPAGDAELEQEQLVEREPASPLLRLLERFRAMERVQRVGAARQAFPLFQRRRERVGLVRNELEGAVGKGAEPRRRDLLAGRVDRRQVGGGGRTVQVVRLDVERVPAELPAEAHTRPGLELVLQPVLVEPDGRDCAAVVRDGRASGSSTGGARVAARRCGSHRRSPPPAHRRGRRCGSLRRSAGSRGGDARAGRERWRGRASAACRRSPGRPPGASRAAPPAAPAAAPRAGEATPPVGPRLQTPSGASLGRV